ncbi:dihydroneopterin aldolase [Caenispirillum bisanense]|uniref:7,8-dihydroneopterin aldolase n=1 Tax=Caenispirillum bisanense TaxID=414052 RepID=A0A286GHC9_9PROT|nr:dihydroneopterin aldolase [Caenispirillum bisanense]SOD94931.1 dihydroneopterin aldolase [Caenispirillum bisanense]
MTPSPVVKPFPIANAHLGLRHVFLRDLLIVAKVGVYKHEHETAQRVRINLDLAVREGEGPVGDRLDEVVCYEEIRNKVRDVVLDRHVNLVETMAERIAQACLADGRIRSVRVRVEKLDVFDDVSSVGVEIERFSTLG